MATNNTVNRIELIGYMGAMPEMRYTVGGMAVTNFSLATNRIWQDQSGESRKETDWHRVTAWGRLAEDPVTEAQAVEEVTQPDAGQPAQPKRSRRKQAA